VIAIEADCVKKSALRVQGGVLAYCLVNSIEDKWFTPTLPPGLETDAPKIVPVTLADPESDL